MNNKLVIETRRNSVEYRYEYELWFYNVCEEGEWDDGWKNWPLIDHVGTTCSAEIMGLVFVSPNNSLSPRHRDTVEIIKHFSTTSMTTNTTTASTSSVL